MLYYMFQAFCEAGLHDDFPGLTEDVAIPGKDYAEAERNARVILGKRYRGTTTVPVTQAILIKF